MTFWLKHTICVTKMLTYITINKLYAETGSL